MKYFSIHRIYRDINWLPNIFPFIKRSLVPDEKQFKVESCMTSMNKKIVDCAKLAVKVWLNIPT